MPRAWPSVVRLSGGLACLLAVVVTPSHAAYTGWRGLVPVRTAGTAAEVGTKPTVHGLKWRRLGSGSGRYRARRAAPRARAHSKFAALGRSAADERTAAAAPGKYDETGASGAGGKDAGTAESNKVGGMDAATAVVAPNERDTATATAAIVAPTKTAPRPSPLDGRPHCPPRLYTSPSSGRKFMATVLGLAAGEEVYGSNSTRLPDFLVAWARAWPGLHIEHQPTFANHPGLRGYGVAAGYYVGLVRSLAYLRQRNASCDYHLMFEDDGLPFNGTTWPGGGHSTSIANDLDARLDALEADHGSALALGGHRFVNVNRADAARAAAQPGGGIVSADGADGAYALVIACSALPHVAAHLHARLRQTTSRFHFEGALWDAFKGTGSGPYVSVPLLVDHAHGFSATWNRTVDRDFEGNATFW